MIAVSAAVVVVFVATIEAVAAAVTTNRLSLGLGASVNGALLLPFVNKSKTAGANKSLALAASVTATY